MQTALTKTPVLTAPTRRPVDRNHRLPALGETDKTGKVLALVDKTWVKTHWVTVHMNHSIQYWMPEVSHA